MAAVKIQVGQFLSYRLSHPDTANDPFSDGGLPKQGKDFLAIGHDPEVDAISSLGPTPVGDPQTINLPRTIGLQAAPPLTTPNVVPFQPAPPITKPGAVAFEPAPGLSVPPPPFGVTPPVITPSVPPWSPSVVPQPPPTSPARFEPLPVPLSTNIGADLQAKDLPVKLSTNVGANLQAKLPPDPVGLIGGPFGPLAREVARAKDAARDRGPEQKPHVPTALGQVDQAVVNFLKEVDRDGQYSEVGGGAPGTQEWNPQMFAKRLTRMGEQLGAAKIALHSAVQVGLFNLNWHGRLWNPNTLNPPPDAGLYVPASVDALVGGGGPNDLLPGGMGGAKFYENNEKVNDRHLQLAQGQRQEMLALPYPPFVAQVLNGGSVGPQNLTNIGSRLIGAPSQDSSLVDDPVFGPSIPGTPIVQAAVELRNMHREDLRYEDSPEFTMKGLIDSVIDGNGKDSDLLENDSQTNLKRVNLSSLFSVTPTLVNSSTPSEYRPQPRIAETRGKRGADPVRKGFFPKGIVPAGFKNEQKGFLQHGRNQDPSSIIDDDESYVPLSFTDVRPYGSGKLRTVYFRPFITNISEDFAAEWTTSNGFGRVDPIKTYAGTTRTINIGFAVQAFAPEDLKVIYQKLMWLSSMVYPEYDSDLLYKSGPVTRMRVGDLVSSTNPSGLGGVIDSLSFDYSEQLWELKKNNKVPMGYRVVVQFTALHDTPIGRGIDGKFGGLGSVDADGLYQPPESVDSKTGRGKKGPDVRGPEAFRNFAEDADDYDPTT